MCLDVVDRIDFVTSVGQLDTLLGRWVVINSVKRLPRGNRIDALEAARGHDVDRGDRINALQISQPHMLMVRLVRTRAGLLGIARDLHLECAFGHLVAARSIAHQVDADLVVATLRKLALVLVAARRADEHRGLGLSGRQDVEVTRCIVGIHADTHVLTLAGLQHIVHRFVALDLPLTVVPFVPGVAIIVSIPDQLVHVYRGGARIGLSTCSTGKQGHSTPTGVFTILQKDKNHHSSTYNNAPMPNMNRLTWSGVALHAGNLPGYPSSHGCVRLPLKFSELLFTVTHVGTPVIIADDHSEPVPVTHPGPVLSSLAAREMGEGCGRSGGLLALPSFALLERRFVRDGPAEA
jgi:hypothetical protein